MAWKVYNEVDDSQVYLKVLYYPKLTSDDLHNLLDRFEDEYRSLNHKNRVSYLLSAGSALGTWALAYRYRFKFTTFLLTTAVAFAATKYTLNQFAQSRMTSNLNSSAQSIANNYPQIKFSRVEYTRSSEVRAAKLL